jgi:DNA-binding NtrC family response regulator
MLSNEVRRVLVVDDRVEMAEMIADELCRHRYAAVATSSGGNARRLMRDERFDALVTDVSMPEVDGLMLLRCSIELDPTRPVILMTAYSSLDTAIAATCEGAYHYLRKPFRLEVLVRLVRDALRMR